MIAIHTYLVVLLVQCCDVMQLFDPSLREGLPTYLRQHFVITRPHQGQETEVRVRWHLGSGRLPLGGAKG